MTMAMRRWLRERGITAVRVADVAGIDIPKLYRQLRGEQEAGPELRRTLCGVFGMTEQEYEETMP